MPAIQDPTKKGRTKCYIHDLQRPLELPYSRLQHHVCWICHVRLLELAQTNFRFKLREQIVTLSIKPAGQEEEADPGNGSKVKKNAKARKKTS